jgi:hypothetical protein
MIFNKRKNQLLILSFRRLLTFFMADKRLSSEKAVILWRFDREAKTYRVPDGNGSGGVDYCRATSGNDPNHRVGA